MKWTNWFNTFLKTSAERWVDADAQEMQRGPKERREVTILIQALYSLVVWPLERLDCLPARPNALRNISNDVTNPEYDPLVNGWASLKTNHVRDHVGDTSWCFCRVVNFQDLTDFGHLKAPNHVIEVVKARHEPDATVEDVLKVVRHSVAHGAWFTVACDPKNDKQITDLLFVNRDPRTGEGGLVAVNVSVAREQLHRFADWIHEQTSPVSYALGAAIPPAPVEEAA